MECRRCGNPDTIKYGFTVSGEQRYECKRCHSITKPTPRREDVVLYTPMPKIRKVMEALAAGESIRKAAAAAGCAKRTVERIIVVMRPPLGDCPCGLPWGHRNWCSYRFSKSPARRSFMAEWRGKRGLLNPEQVAFCQRMGAMGYPPEEIAEMTGFPEPSVTKALAAGSKIEEALAPEGGL